MKDNRTRMKYVFALSKYISNYKIKLLLSVIIHGIFKLMPILIGFMTALIIGEAVAGDLVGTFKYFYIVLGLIIVNAVFNYLDVLVSHDMTYRILTQLRGRSFEKIAQISPGGIDSEESGNIMSTILEDIEILEWFFAHTTNQIIVALLLPVSGLIVLSCFSLWISLLVIVFIILILFVPICMKEKSNKQGIELQNRLGKLNAVIIDGIQGLKDIVTFQWHSEYIKHMSSVSRSHSKAMEKYTLRANNETIITVFLIGISYVASTALILFLYTKGNYEFKWVLPLIILSSTIYSPLQETLSMSSNYGRIFGAAKRVLQFLERKPFVSDNGTLTHKDIINKKSNSGILFKNVNFTYPTYIGEANNNICKNISFQIANYETAVLVGKSGCGKSTCIKLLQRFWDVDRGEILINGVNIKDIKLSELKKMISVVPQDTYIFNMSILDNLRLAKIDATEEEIIDALKKANAYDFVINLADGLNTVVGERGISLSGGEKQRLSIAQAFLRDSKILLLDEASANLDSENESIVNESINQLKMGRITLMIAHRVSTIKNSDKIIIIKDGKIEDSGTYEALTERSKYFNYLIGHDYE